MVHAVHHDRRRRGKYDRDSYGNGKSDTQNQYNFGLGTFFGTSKRVALRADIRGLYTLDSEKLQPWAGVGFVFKVGGAEGACVPRQWPRRRSTPTVTACRIPAMRARIRRHGVKVDSPRLPARQRWRRCTGLSRQVPRYAARHESRRARLPDSGGADYVRSDGRVRVQFRGDQRPVVP